MLLVTQHREHCSSSVAEKQNTVLNCYRFNQFLVEGIMHSPPTVNMLIFLVCFDFVGFFSSVICVRIQLLF